MNVKREVGKQASKLVLQAGFRMREIVIVGCSGKTRCRSLCKERMEFELLKGQRAVPRAPSFRPTFSSSPSQWEWEVPCGR